MFVHVSRKWACQVGSVVIVRLVSLSRNAFRKCGLLGLLVALVLGSCALDLGKVWWVAMVSLLWTEGHRVWLGHATSLGLAQKIGSTSGDVAMVMGNHVGTNFALGEKNFLGGGGCQGDAIDHVCA